MVILYQLNLCQLFYKLLKQPNYFGRFWQFMRRTRQSLMVHEGAKLNNFNAVCLIIVAHEGAKFNEPGDGLTNQLCRRHSAFVRTWGASKPFPPFNFSINYSWFLLLHSRLIILNTPREEAAFTAPPEIQSQCQIFRYGRSIFCLPHRPNFSDIFDLWLHWVSVVRAILDSKLKLF